MSTRDAEKIDGFSKKIAHASRDAKLGDISPYLLGIREILVFNKTMWGDPSLLKQYETSIDPKLSLSDQLSQLISLFELLEKKNILI